MREIKFRAWDNKWKVMVKYFHIKSQDNEKSKITFVTYPSYREDIPVSNQNLEGDYELMQYTGLKDKNGKKIYEGDIVKGVVKFPQLTTFDTDENSNYKMCGKVYYDHSGFSLECIQALCQKDRYGMVNYFDFIGGDGEIFDEMEIIGNEFENQELLK